MKTKTRLVRLLFVLFIGLSANVSFAQVIDSERSTVTFKVSNMYVNTVTGSFSDMIGQLNFDPQNWQKATFSVCIDAATVNTGNKARDAHLRKPDFFDVDAHPTICFVSTDIRRKGRNQYELMGDLTMLDVTRRVAILFTQDGKVLNGSLSINRLNYGLGKGSNTFLVGDKVDIEIRCVLK